MELAIFALPFIAAVMLLLFFRKQTTWWEYILLIVPSILLALLLEFSMKSYNTDDIEYLGGYVTKIRHYDRWNEYIHRTCTREVPDGVDEKGHTKYRTEEYDCSYVEDHPERWTYFDNLGHESHFYCKEDWDKVRRRFGTEMHFVDMNRHYYTIDGDAQDYFWDGTLPTAKTLTTEHRYENRVKTSRSIFKFEDIDDKSAKELGVFEYPKLYDYDQRPIMGLKFPDAQEDRIRWLNGYYGPKRQFRLFLLFFKDRNEDIVETQRSYWQGGNKNELVVCVGYDGKTKKAKWCNAFSWSDEPILETATRQWFMNNPLDLSKYADFIEPYIKTNWNRKQFKEFDYLTVELSDTQYTVILIITLLYNIAMSVWVVLNDYRNDGENRKGRTLGYHCYIGGKWRNI